MSNPATWRLYDGGAAGYDQYRPRYPEDVFDFLARYHLASAPLRSAADIGAGTGIFSRQLMKSVPTIVKLICIEANADMVAVAKERSEVFEGLEVVLGFAESLPLPDHSCDLVTAATSAHRFDRSLFYKEAARVLKPSGTLLFLRNSHRFWESAFLEDFEAFQERHIPGYRRGLYTDCTGGYAKADFEAELRAHSDLVAVERQRIEWSQAVTANQFRGYCYSTHINTAVRLSSAAVIAREIDSLLQRHQDASGNVAVKWLTDLVLSRANL
ncbi:class I SAM-dependent methyltransferase [Bradyrhizobium elkanii]|uniref:class I SAM-dependent methyltransferase n=1 Tax=Bradyrhizobium elkanii TaxID=29448 RepID=UPI001448EC7C|nr:class I SAM-dependent methyltransferase [Bradyrhizobium elkanii]MCP1927779.1 SAM-dependent methyltransferase [Bradyrhizobium elkanii]MCS3581612.1 SAM-dependent methyltransferase [Bradyrhizobium elkanii]MCS3724486.1 SAM-dependent methyltransferase [Bradyrhizobium elkanii]MCS4008898.1 SAM-dependent methyltransferase [Bradyrhizobium elkanii USDA 61]BBB94769.1 hypothetical protein BE61_01790 [Bradyrhizobium elkanii USDA 61]